MAGFAIVMTIATYGLAALGVAALMSMLLHGIAVSRIRRGKSGQRAARVARVAPFLALLWLAIAFAIHVEISNRVAHQDSGLSPDPFVTLPNGYVLGSLNTYDGYFTAPGYETAQPIAGPGYVRSIVNLRIAGPLLTGTQFDFSTSRMRRFVYDTRTMAFSASEADSQPVLSTARDSLDAWGDAMTHVQHDPDSYWKIYSQYWKHWPRYVFIALVVAGEIGIVFWVALAWTARRTAAQARAP